MAFRKLTLKNEMGRIGDLREAVGELRHARGALERFGAALGELGTSFHESGDRDVCNRIDGATDWVGEAYEKLDDVRRMLLSEVDRLELEACKRYRAKDE